MKLVPIGLLVLLAAACTNRPSRPRPTAPTAVGKPAHAVASDLFVCPGGYAWAGYGRIVYAPNDTSKPTAEIQPDRCFASLEQAREVGFHLRPPPPGGELIDTIYLVPPDPPVLPACRRAAERLAFTVLCPTLVPGTPDSTAGCENDCLFSNALVLSFSFSGPPGYVGIPAQIGNHVFLMESRVGRESQLEFLMCFDGRATGDVAVQGTTGQWVSCPANGSGMNSGHVMLVWVQQGIRYAVSLHADTDLNRRIALALAQRLTPVGG